MASSAAACPSCSGAFPSHYDERKKTAHVNHCLDGTARPFTPPKPASPPLPPPPAQPARFVNPCASTAKADVAARPPCPYRGALSGAMGKDFVQEFASRHPHAVASLVFAALAEAAHPAAPPNVVTGMLTSLRCKAKWLHVPGYLRPEMSRETVAEDDASLVSAFVLLHVDRGIMIDVVKGSNGWVNAGSSTGFSMTLWSGSRPTVYGLASESEGDDEETKRQKDDADAKFHDRDDSSEARQARRRRRQRRLHPALRHLTGEALITLPFLRLHPDAAGFLLGPKECSLRSALGEALRDEDTDKFERHLSCTRACEQPPLWGALAAAEAALEPFLPSSELPDFVEKIFERVYDPDGDGVNDFCLVKRETLQSFKENASRKKYIAAARGQMRFDATGMSRAGVRYSDAGVDVCRGPPRLLGIPLPPRASLSDPDTDAENC